MKSTTIRRMSYERKKAWVGRGFISLWFVGLSVFFLYPMISSFLLTFQRITFDSASLPVYDWVGLGNYTKFLFSDPYVLGYLLNSLAGVFSSLPLIILFSLFAAVLINRKFKGRGLVRSIFFFPVIITSGALIYVLQTETVAVQQAGANAVMLRNVDVGRILNVLLGNARFAAPIVKLMDQVFVIIWKSGVQTLLFLAGLQSISGSLYECASVEGATAWEKFWKITVPLISPVILINVVYTIVDSFTDYNNEYLRYVMQQTFGNVELTYGATIAWVYFAVTFVMLMAIVGIISRNVYYAND